MLKLLSVLVLGGAASLTVIATAHACGGGGGGSCGSSGRGRSYGRTRATAATKVISGGPSLAKAPRAGGQGDPKVAARRSAQSATAKTRTVASTKAKPAAQRAAAKPTSYYTCPMHPQIRWTKPDDCPICGMKLKAQALKRHANAAPSQHAATADEVSATSEHEGMDMGDGQGGMEGMEGMDDMMMCPGCMNMGGMSRMNGGSGAARGSQKTAPRGSSRRGMGRPGCGC